ncbi:nuclear transport factor 2 family protein [Flagellimonas myxillae]|uniref:nuclear transport factor 2 family protein n=1 Tax=Flagellimonas myxillae TaxID=2942214 RepID=UPI00201F3582|nr:ester cyclase [Muricauda myxillae]MCL6265498.1 ester cyclase [Muricauda myxillae]
MKKLYVLGLVVALFAACNQGPTRYTQNSPEIDTVKKLLANYDSKSYDTSMYADTSKTNYNSSKSMSPSETMEYHKQTDANYSSRGFNPEDQDFEMVVTDKGETWVNCWVEWKGTLAANGKEVKVPLHLTYRFVDGKIVREYGYWDPTEIVLTLRELEEAAKMAKEESQEE